MFDFWEKLEFEFDTRRKRQLLRMENEN